MLTSKTTLAIGRLQGCFKKVEGYWYGCLFKVTCYKLRVTGLDAYVKFKV
ncbi:hypothetical protein QE439_002303 [Pedobacter agri]|nr:hypothetical protein [Pedobacter agri]